MARPWGPSACQASRWAACDAAHTGAGCSWRWVLLVRGSFSSDHFSRILVLKIGIFWVKRRAVWRQIHYFFKWELLSWIVRPPTSPRGSAQSKSSAASWSKGLSDSSFLQWVIPQGTTTNFLKSKGCPNNLAKQMFYCSVVQGGDHTVVQNNLQSLQ